MKRVMIHAFINTGDFFMSHDLRPLRMLKVATLPLVAGPFPPNRNNRPLAENNRLSARITDTAGTDLIVKLPPACR